MIEMVPMPEERLRLLYELGCEFTARQDFEELVPTVMRRCRLALSAEGAALLLLDRSGEWLTFPYASQSDPEVARRLASLRLPANVGIAGLTLRERRSLRIDDVASHPNLYRGIEDVTGLPIRSMLSVPLFTARGPLGVLQVVNALERTFDDADLQFLESLSASIAIALDNAWLYERLKESETAARAEVGLLRQELPRRTRFAEIIGESRALREVLALVESAALVRLNVLVRGETGTGKELVARALHRAGRRAEKPFVAVNCAALPEGLLESELFGHRRGAFTGALEDRQGVFEAAAGGTVFLDEIGDLPLLAQSKLLRVLEGHEIVRLGEQRSRAVDVSIVAATNTDLDAAVARGAFRGDLFYRVAGFSILLPPVRERESDVLLLASHFLAQAAAAHGKPCSGFGPDAVEKLLGHDWPGNVREIRNEMERVVALASTAQEKIGARDLSFGRDQAPRSAAVLDTLAESGFESPAPEAELRGARARFEAELIEKALQLDRGNVSAAARRLGISRVMLHKKVRRYGLARVGRGA